MFGEAGVDATERLSFVEHLPQATKDRFECRLARRLGLLFKTRPVLQQIPQLRRTDEGHHIASRKGRGGIFTDCATTSSMAVEPLRLAAPVAEPSLPESQSQP